MTKRIPMAVALAAFAMACSDPMTSTPTRTLVPNTSSLAVTATIGYPFVGILDGQLRLCKTSNVLGTYNFTASGGGAAPITALVTNPSITIDVSGETECTIIYRSSVSQASGAETITITETSVGVPLAMIDIVQFLDPTVGAGPFPFGNLGDAPYRNDAFVLGTRTATVKINNDMARSVTFTNTAEPTGGEGCTPGYWKNHDDSWAATGFAQGATLESVFNVPDSYGLDNVTLLDALSLKGGSTVAAASQILLRAAVAALLNAGHPGVDYAELSADIIADVNAALASGNRDTILALATTLDNLNNAGCTIN
jgi:hypothetical protein